jgi:putative ABC transport system permease protein
LVAIGGVAFAITMVLLQLGFLQAVRITATDMYEHLDFDIVLVPRTYDQFYASGVFPRERLQQALGVAGVTGAAPLYARFALWRCPPFPVDRPLDKDDDAAEPNAIERFLRGDELPRPLKRRQLMLLGIDVANHPFRGAIHEAIERARPELTQANRVLLDEMSNLDFGWPLVGKFDDWELEQTRVKIVGGFPLLRGFAADGFVICSDVNFATAFEVPTIGFLQFGFLKVAESGNLQTVTETVRRLNDNLPPDVMALSRKEILERESNHWVGQTSTGQLFAFGVLVAMIVAAVVVYQVLSNDVRDHLAEYATLKAMGHGNLFLSGVVLQQAVIYAGSAYSLAVGIAILAYFGTERLAGIPMEMTLANLGLTLLMAVSVALISALFTLKRVWQADPAELF